MKRSNVMVLGRRDLILRLLLVTFICVNGHTLDNQTSHRVTETLTESQFLEKILNPDIYDPRIKPKGHPTPVIVDFHIYSLSSVNEVNMEYSISLYLRQKWKDDRLKFGDSKDFNSSLSLNYRLYDKIWVPDLFFRNEKRSIFHEVTVPNRLIKISPDGTIYYSQRVSLILSCDMHLANYPMDNQFCRIEMETYSFTNNELLFEWSKEQPLYFEDGISLPEFIFNKDLITIGDCTGEYVTGKFSCIYAQFHFIRMIRYHLIQTYIPTTLIVILSWVSFWIDIDAVPARISLGLLTVLTMATWNSGTASILPRVSYIRAIDVWYTACIAFVFAALVEFSLVNVLARKVRKQSSEKTEKVTANENSSDEDDSSKAATHAKKFLEKLKKNSAYCADVVARVLFPVSFICFASTYWFYYYIIPKGKH